MIQYFFTHRFALIRCARCTVKLFLQPPQHHRFKRRDAFYNVLFFTQQTARKIYDEHKMRTYNFLYKFRI